MPSHRAQQPQRAVADPQHPQRVAGRVVGDPVREVRADVGHAEHVDQELGELVGPRGRARRPGRERASASPAPLGEHRVLVAHRPDARPRRRDDGVVPGEGASTKCSHQRQRLVAVAGVDVHLPAAGLRHREHDLVPEALEQPVTARPTRGNSASLRQVMNSAIRTVSESRGYRESVGLVACELVGPSRPRPHPLEVAPHVTVGASLDEQVSERCRLDRAGAPVMEVGVRLLMAPGKTRRSVASIVAQACARSGPIDTNLPSRIATSDRSIPVGVTTVPPRTTTSIACLSVPNPAGVAPGAPMMSPVQDGNRGGEGHVDDQLAEDACSILPIGQFCAQPAALAVGSSDPKQRRLLVWTGHELHAHGAIPGNPCRPAQ